MIYSAMCTHSSSCLESEDNEENRTISYFQQGWKLSKLCTHSRKWFCQKMNHWIFCKYCLAPWQMVIWFGIFPWSLGNWTETEVQIKTARTIMTSDVLRYWKCHRATTSNGTLLSEDTYSSEVESGRCLWKRPKSCDGLYHLSVWPNIQPCLHQRLQLTTTSCISWRKIVQVKGQT